MTGEGRRFEILYSRWLLPLFLVLGLGPSFTRVELSDAELTVRMGWGFSRRSLARRSPGRTQPRLALGYRRSYEYARRLARERLVERDRLAPDRPAG